MKNSSITRRKFIKTSAATAAGVSMLPLIQCSSQKSSKPMMREFGRLGFEVTTLGLGGQASIQWTPEDVDPVKIILKAFDKGVNYFDTSNLYGPSQNNYGLAFQQLNLIPGTAGYDEKKRRSIFLTTKTHLRYAKADQIPEGVRHRTNGPQGSMAVDDIKRSLTQMFGDGKGNYPKDAYLDMVLIHSLTSMDEVDILYEGLNDTDPKADRIGALAALRDYRDGSNLTGLNPKEERLIRHIGFSGHHNPAAMMEIIQRDKDDLLDAMLVAINANDLLNFNMQYNVIPVANAKKMGLIAMKVFADGAMYTKDPEWSREPRHVVRTVGSPVLPSDPLVKYSLTTPGIHTAIIGIGEISDDPQYCQLTQNFNAAQITSDGLKESDRLEIEKQAAGVKNGKTNYFQIPEQALSAPRDVNVSQDRRKSIEITWQTAFAGNSPIQHYEVWRENKKIGEVKHRPQVTKEPFIYHDKLTDHTQTTYKVITVDALGRKSESDKVVLS